MEATDSGESGTEDPWDRDPQAGPLEVLEEGLDGAAKAADSVTINAKRTICFIEHLMKIVECFSAGGGFPSGQPGWNAIKPQSEGLPDVA